MQIDHLFIFSNQQGIEADALVEFGLTEGSSRTHPGQGTTNRKFYFDNFFLEVLWVIDEEEIKSNLTRKTKLWERSNFHQNGYSPFGLCLVNNYSSDALFANSMPYQPTYFPEGMVIEMITNENHPQWPSTFRLPFKGAQKLHHEPTQHANGINSLTKAVFEINSELNNEAFSSHFNHTNNVTFSASERMHLTLIFDHEKQRKEKVFDSLMLTINY